MIIDTDRREPPFFCTYVCQFGFKTHLTAKSNDFFTHRFDDMTQHIRADMGFIYIENLRFCSKFHKKLKYLSMTARRVLYQSV